jgi:hypothetical protein
MRSRWTALVFVLVLAGLTPRAGFAQGRPPQTPPRKPAASVGGLSQNFPNPMNPETFIPFTVGDYPSCSEPGRQYVVTLKIFNAITQPIAIPLVQKGGRPLNKLQLTCGQYTAYWDGYIMGRRQKAPSGNYPYILQVDGQSFRRSMTVAK